MKTGKTLISASIIIGLSFASVPILAFATSADGDVELNTEIATSIAMKIASPNDTNPDCMTQSGVPYGIANRYATSNSTEGSKQVDTFDGTIGGADEININTSCATLTMNPNSFSSTYSDVTVYTNSGNGYALSILAAEPNLVNTTDSTYYIPAGTLTEDNGVTPGGQNKWAVKANIGILDTWTPVSTTNTTVRSYDQETSGGSTTRVTYGISTGNNPTGKYATTLTYTATMFDGGNTTISAASIVADSGTYRINGRTNSTVRIPYNETRALTISPTEGHYLTSITCSGAYTCGDINGDPLVISDNNTDPVTIYATNNSRAGIGIITLIVSTVPATPATGCSAADEGSTYTIDGIEYICLADGNLWTKNSQGSATWDNAAALCPSDAHLPSAQEFGILLSHYGGSPNSFGQYGYGVSSSALYDATSWSSQYWSSTTYEDAPDAAYLLGVNSFSAGVNSYLGTKTNLRPVVCVR